MTNNFAATKDSKPEDSQQEPKPAFVLKDLRQVREGQVVLDDINFEIARGAITALVGPSGAGKI